MCRQIVQATAPREYIQHARNPLKNVRIGGNATVFAPNYGSPFAFDLDNGRRYATIEDFQQLRQAHVPVAVPPPQRWHGVRAGRRAGQQAAPRHGACAPALQRQAVHGIRHGCQPRPGFGRHGHGSVSAATSQDRTVHDQPDQRLVAVGVGRHDARVRRGLRPQQPGDCIITPFILAGAMAPTTSAGVAAQTLAESLAGMTFTQLIRPGAPVIFGSFASSMSMQTGAPTFGTPEPAIVLYTIAALARRLGVPFRIRWLADALRRSPTRRPRTRAPQRCCRPCWPAPTSCCTPPAGRRAACRSATRSSSWTRTSAG